jgi:hypothetical protein
MQGSVGWLFAPRGCPHGPQAQSVEAYLESTGRQWEGGGQLHRIEA